MIPLSIALVLLYAILLRVMIFTLQKEVKQLQEEVDKLNKKDPFYYSK
jgi:hypothetical protein